MFHNRTPLQKLLLLKAFSSGGQSFIERTATGNPLTFGTDVSKPLKSLFIPFTPQQSGTGDPSPENIRSILPWNGLSVWCGGGNLMPHPTKGNGVNPTTGASITDETRASTDFIPAPLTGNKSYTFSGICDTMNSFVASYNANKQFLGRTLASSRTEITVTKDSFTYGTAQGTGEVAYLRFAQAEGSSGHSIDEIDDYDYMMNVGSSALPYEPYKPITETAISFPSPVYGGTLDMVTGVLTVEWYGIVKKWSEGANPAVYANYTRKSFSFPYPVRGVDGTYFAQQKCNITKLAWSTDQNTHFYINNSTAYLWLPNDTDADQEIQLVSKLVTPQEIQLTPTQITAIVGDNTILSDADGSMTAVYLVSSKYAEEHPVGGLSSGLGSGLGSGLLGSGTGDDPENPEEPTEPDEPIEEPVEDGQEEGETE